MKKTNNKHKHIPNTPDAPNKTQYGMWCIQESTKKTIQRFMDHSYFNMIEDYPEVKKFLATHEWQVFLKKHTVPENNLAPSDSLWENQKSHKFSSLMNKAALYLITLLTLQQWLVSCRHPIDENSEMIQELIKKHNVGAYSEALKNIKIVDDNNTEKESIRYREAFQYFDKAKIELARLQLFPNENIHFNRFLPLMIKESRLVPVAVSKNWAVWYFQLKDIAIEEVNDYLQKHWINTKSYSPKTNPSHNILYWIIYFLHTAKLLQDQYPDIHDVDDFVYASYNAGITKVTTLLEDNKAKSRDDFVHDILHRKMWLSGKNKEIDWPYGPKVRDFFDWKDYSKDDKVIFQHGKIILTKSKSQEIIRYVETINSIATSIDKSRWLLEYYTIVPIKKWSTFFATIKDMKKDGKIKVKDGTNLINFCNDIALDNNMVPDHITSNDTLIITKNMMDEFDYADKNVFTYDVATYNKETKYFLWKIVKDRIKDKWFQKNIIQKIPQLTALEDDGDKEFYLMNSLIEYNTKNRKWRGVTTSKDVRIPSDPKYYIDFFTHSDKEAKETEDNTAIDIKNNYTITSLESVWNELVYQWNYKEKDMPTIERSFKHVISKKQSKQKEKLTHPNGIVLHSTGGNINDVPWVKAHFYVSKKWEIYMLADDQGNLRKLNHAGVGMTWCWAIRNWNMNLTYDFIGIEVEALGWERRNDKEYEAVEKLISYLWRKYKIQKKNVLTHSQVAFSSVGRWRKQDPYYVNWKKLWMPDNYMEIDKDVAHGKSPNMTQFVKELKDKWMTNAEIKDYLSWLDAGIAIANANKVKKMGAQDHCAWLSSSTILKNY